MIKKSKLSVSVCVFLLVALFTVSAAYAEQGSLKRGSTGDAVLKVQQMLQQHGYYSAELDGIFGQITHRAVLHFQLDCALTPDGVVGSETLLALEQFDPVSVQRTSRGADFDRKGQGVVEYAQQFLGTPYVWAGMSPGGFDCSGFTTYIYGEFGVSLSHRADYQFGEGYYVSELQPGDLVFFSTYEVGPSHVGIYMGNDKFIHASSGAGEVTITALSSGYYSERYLGARRVLD